MDLFQILKSERTDRWSGHGINIITIALNQQCWSAENTYQWEFFSERYISSDVSSPPFDKIAEQYNCDGIKVERTADFGEANMNSLDSDKPAVIDFAG